MRCGGERAAASGSSSGRLAKRRMTFAWAKTQGISQMLRVARVTQRVRTKIAGRQWSLLCVG